MSGIVTLVSQDQQKIEVELNVIRQSKVCFKYFCGF